MNILFGVIFGLIFIIIAIFLCIFRLKNGTEMLLKLFYSISHLKRSDYHYKIASFILLFSFIASFLGIVCCIYGQFKSATPVTNLLRPDAGSSDSTISIVADSELYTGKIDIPLNAREYTFDEAANIFLSYRNELDAFVLGENESFMNVTSPLRFPSSIGSENIAISWHIEYPDIINYSGEPVNDNISIDGSETEITATLSLGKHSADICYYVIVYPKELSSKERFISSLNDILNSSENISKKDITLPSDIDGIPVSFYKEKTVFPSMDNFSFDYFHTCPSNCT